MGTYYTAYCYNPENGYDFGKEQQVPPNLMETSDLQSYNNINPPKPTDIATKQFEQIDENMRGDITKESIYPWFKETGRTKAMALRCKSTVDPGAVGYYVGMHMCTFQWLHTPTQLKAGTVITMSVYVYNNDDYAHNFVTGTNESNDPSKWNEESEFSSGVEMSIEPKTWERLEWQYTLKYDHIGNFNQVGDLGMRVFQDWLSQGIKADFLIAMPKVELGIKATPYRMTEEDEKASISWRTCDPYYRPYVGRSVTDSDNWEDYTGWELVSEELLDNRYADIGWTKAEAHIIILPESAREVSDRINMWVGIDSDTFEVGTGRTVHFSQLNMEYNFTGQVVECATDNTGAYNYNDSTWVNMGDIMYSSQSGLLIDCVLGEMGNSIQDGSVLATGTLTRVDEVARDLIVNQGASYTGAYANVDYNVEANTFRVKTASLKVSSATYPDASGGASSYIENIWNYGMSTKPFKVNPFTTNSTWTKGMSNFIYNDGVTYFSRIHNNLADWFRGGNIGDIKPLPQRIMMLNMNTKKWWWFDYDKSQGLWVRSSEKTLASVAPTLISSAYSSGLPRDGKLKGSIVFTDKSYTDYASKNMPRSLGLDILFPDERKEFVYYAPFWHDGNYTSDMNWWGATSSVRTKYLYNDQKYGKFGVSEIDLMNGTCTMRRVWNS